MCGSCGKETECQHKRLEIKTVEGKKSIAPEEKHHVMFFSASALSHFCHFYLRRIIYTFKATELHISQLANHKFSVIPV